MLVITAEIWPGGSKADRFTIGEILAANESALAPVSSYTAAISQRPAPLIGVQGFREQFTVHGHDRAAGVWALVFSILEAQRNAELGRAPR